MSHSLLHSPEFFQNRHIDSIRMKAIQFRGSDHQSSDRVRVRRNEVVLKILKKILNTPEPEKISDERKS